MNEVQKVALQRALSMLKAAGAQFAVIVDGEKYGDLLVQPPKPPKPERQRAPAHNFMQYGYREKVRAMQPGAAIAIEIPASIRDDKKLRDGLAGAICACGVTEYGNGNFMTARSLDGKAIECVRIL